MTTMLPKFLDRYRHLLPSVLLLGGFILDVVTFRTLKPSVTFALLGAYAFAAAMGILLGERAAGPLRKVVPMVVQFAFGALLSSSLLFYWFGGTVAASWPVMLAVVVLMVSNETFRDAFLRPTVQFGVFGFVFFSYCTLLFPYLLRSVNAGVFILGGAAATVVSLLLAEAIARTDKSRRPLLRQLRRIAVGTYAVFTVLYFLNIIPPIPLSIRDAGIYHDVTVRDGEYLLQSEPESLLQKLWPGQRIGLEHDGDGRIYAYTAIFAPTNLSTVIVHRWQRYDVVAKHWVDAGSSSYTTRGGRTEGYRGYSYRTINGVGRWRVLIETERGQELGRLNFTVIEAE
jgi:hypothetical protein